MKNLVAFFEIPAANFDRAVKFYETVLNIKLSVMDCEAEKMAFFPEENEKCPGSISWAKDFNPSKDGVLVFACRKYGSGSSHYRKERR